MKLMPRIHGALASGLRILRLRTKSETKSVQIEVAEETKVTSSAIETSDRPLTLQYDNCPIDGRSLTRWALDQEIGFLRSRSVIYGGRGFTNRPQTLDRERAENLLGRVDWIERVAHAHGFDVDAELTEFRAKIHAAYAAGQERAKKTRERRKRTPKATATVSSSPTARSKPSIGLRLVPPINSSGGAS